MQAYRAQGIEEQNVKNVHGGGVTSEDDQLPWGHPGQGRPGEAGEGFGRQSLHPLPLLTSWPAGPWGPGNPGGPRDP